MNENKPQVIFWFKVYAGVLCAIYAVTMLAGVASIALAMLDDKAFDGNPVEGYVTGGLCLAVGLVFFIASLLPFLCKPRPWLWIYNIVVIALGCTSCCTLPFCIWMLIFWIKPEVKQYYQRN